MRFLIFLFLAVFALGCAEPARDFTTLGITASAKDPPRPRGRVIVAESTTSPSDGIVIGSTASSTVGVYDLRAMVEPMVLEDFCFESLGDPEIIATAYVIYTNPEGTTTTSSSFVEGGYVCFADQEVSIPLRSTVHLTVSIDTGFWFWLSGDTIQLNWTDFGARAVGQRSRTVYDERAVTDFVEGPTMTFHITKPTVSLSSGSPSGDGFPGFGEIFRPNMAADTHGYVGFEWATFGFDSTDNEDEDEDWNSCANMGDSDRWALYDMDDLATNIDESWTFTASDGNDCETSPDLPLISATVTLIETEEVAAGATTTYSLKVNTEGASSAADDSVRASLKDIGWLDDSYDSEIYGGTYIHTLPVMGYPITY